MNPQGVDVQETFSNEQLDSWLRSDLGFDNSPEHDARRLARNVELGETLLRKLPPMPLRSEVDSLHARTIHRSNREARKRFLSQHKHWLYDSLTSAFACHLTLRDLAFKAAELCPGLVPSASQIQEEREHRQSDKEGREQDQAYFFHELFKHPKIGAHLAKACLRPTERALSLLDHFLRDAYLNLGSVTIQREDSAAHVTINNAYCLNAEDDRLVDDLETAIDLAYLDDSVTVGIVRGGIMHHHRHLGKRIFSAGINLKALASGQISFVDFLLRRELGFISKIFRGLNYQRGEVILDDDAILTKPWIAAVDGFAIGGGAQMLLVFDHVIASKESYFSLPAANEGIVPGFANLRLGRSLGIQMAKQVIYFGKTIVAGGLHSDLIFDEVVNQDEMDLAIKKAAHQLSSSAVAANKVMLNLSYEPIDLFIQYASEFSRVQGERIYSRDVLNKIAHRI